MADKKISDFTAKSNIDAGDYIEIETSGGNSRKVLAQAAGIASGTSFPSLPSSNDKFYHSDRNIEYYYDGTRWLSTQLFTLTVDVLDAIFPATVTGTHSSNGNPWSGLYDIYVIEIATWALSISSGNWTIAVASVGTGAATLQSYTISTATEGVTRTTVGAVVPSTILRFNLTLTENSGTMSVYVKPQIIYRLIG